MTKCLSSPADREDINAVLRSELDSTEGAAFLNRELQQWKYWAPHPLTPLSRSHILKKNGTVVGHACAWPVRLLAPSGELNTFHLVDWAARRDRPGTGIQVLRYCCDGMAAAFSIGGSAMTRKILPLAGFKTYNRVAFLFRPLRPVQSAVREAPLNWQTPARALRNVWWALEPKKRLPHGWEITIGDSGNIPQHLLPVQIPGQAVSVRSPEILAHIMACPALRGSACCVLKRGGECLAYLLLVRVGRQVRLADYGPPGLDEETSMVLGTSAQMLARSAFPGAATLVAATTEEPVRTGWIRSGLHAGREETISALKLNPALDHIDRFWMTLLDWDAVCL